MTAVPMRKKRTSAPLSAFAVAVDKQALWFRSANRFTKQT
jgi:hypothetical protein